MEPLVEAPIDRTHYSLDELGMPFAQRRRIAGDLVCARHGRTGPRWRRVLARFGQRRGCLIGHRVLAIEFDERELDVRASHLPFP